LLLAGRFSAVPLIADRFLRLKEGGEVVDLATTEVVHLAIEPSPANGRTRAAVCDRLAARVSNVGVIDSETAR